MHCLICNNKSGLEMIEEHGKYRIYRCQVCGLQFADPLEYDIKMYQEAGEDVAVSDYYTNYMSQAIGQLESFKNYLLPSYARLGIKLIKDHIQAGSTVFDVGCGEGLFLAALKKAGYHPVGMEVDKNRVDLLQKKGFDVIDSVNAYSDKHEKPMVITLFEVIEHLPDPVGILKDLAERFPQAALLVSVPSPKRWSLGGGKYDPWDYPPNHLTRWSEKSLQKALSDLGYKVKITHPYVVAEEISGSGIARKIISLFSKSKKQEANISYGAPAVENKFKLLRKVVFWPLALFYNLRGYRGSSMVAVALPGKKHE